MGGGMAERQETLHIISALIQRFAPDCGVVFRADLSGEQLVFTFERGDRPSDELRSQAALFSEAQDAMLIMGALVLRLGGRVKVSMDSLPDWRRDMIVFDVEPMTNELVVSVVRRPMHEAQR